MGAMNATGWLLVVAASDDTDELWDFAGELRDRLGDRIAGGVPGLHGFTTEERQTLGVPRYCFHPTGETHVEFRSNALSEALLMGCSYLATLLPEDELWRRD